MSSISFSEIAEKPPEERDFEENLLTVMREKFFAGHISDVELMEDRASDYGFDKVTLANAVTEEEIKNRVVAHFFGGTYEEAEKLVDIAQEAGVTKKSATEMFRQHEQIEYDSHVVLSDLKNLQGRDSISRPSAKRQ